MWIEIIREVAADCEFRSPALVSDLEAVEALLKLRLPTSLRSLLEETDGVYSPYAYLNIVWSAHEIGRRNRELRDDTRLAESYMSFESLLFFAGAGWDGILFAFPITAAGIVQDRNIIAWYPITDSRPVVAVLLQDYLKGWLKGDLKV
jgi:hypothetical protein